MGASMRQAVDAEIIAAAIASTGGNAASVTVWVEKQKLECGSIERITWFVLSIRVGDVWEVVGLRRSKAELLTLAKRGRRPAD